MLMSGYMSCGRSEKMGYYAIVHGENDNIMYMSKYLEEAVDKWKENYADGIHKVVKINGFWKIEGGVVSDDGKFLCRNLSMLWCIW